jgi:hypothetical protein
MPGAGVEPPPLLGEGNPSFAGACAEFVESFEAEGPTTAVNGFLSRLVGLSGVTTSTGTSRAGRGRRAGRRLVLRQGRPGPHRLAVQVDAGQVTQPVLCVGGTRAARGARRGTAW